MGAVIIGLRPGDHKLLDHLAELRGRQPKEVAGILLEEAIRRESGIRMATAINPSTSLGPEAA